MTRMLCPKCGESPSKHTDEGLLDHLIECNMFINYVKSLKGGPLQ